MSGQSPSLSKGARVVVDIDLIRMAATQLRDGTPGEPRRLFELLEIVCCRLVVGPKGSKALLPHLRKDGFRFFNQTPTFTLLRRRDPNKIAALDSSKIPEFEDESKKIFRARGHDDVTDDRHLYELAAACERIVITRDDNLLARRDDLKSACGVRTLALDEAIEELELTLAT